MGNRSIAFFLMFCFVATLFPCGMNSARGEELQDVVAIVEQIKNEAPGIKLDFWKEGTTTGLPIGEPVVFGFSTDKDCYVAVIDLGTSGNVTLLFPNKWHTNNKAEKGVKYSIPPQKSDYLLRVKGPAGTERVKVVACLDPIFTKVESLQEEIKTPVGESTPGGSAFLSMKRPRIVLKDIAATLEKVDPSRWATVEVVFDIVNPGTSESTPQK
jgi:hypothetical protein